MHTSKSSLVLELILASSCGGFCDEAFGKEELTSQAASDQVLKAQLADCFTPPDAAAPNDAYREVTVNGQVLTPIQVANVAWISRCVVPRLPGTPAEQANAAAITTWWSLREGILDLPGQHAFRYSNCHEQGHDRARSNYPMYQCPTSIWQVGIAAAQVANFSDVKVRSTAARIFGDLDPKYGEASILGWSASLAGFPEGSSTYRAIQRSTGKVRRSWLIRNPLIGMLLVGRENVVQECFVDKKHWCFGASYPSAARFSRNETAMRKSVSDLDALFLNRL